MNDQHTLPPASPSRDADSEEVGGFYFLVGEREPTRYGFVWRVWTGGTSFYIKPRWRSLSYLKISLHGPDPRPGLTPFFKLDRDHDAPLPDYHGGTQGFLPCVFPGRQVGHGMTHVVRVAVPGDTFSHPAARLGPPAGNVGVGMRGRFAEIPPDGSFAALDLYVSDSALPMWDGRARMESQNAIAGELENAAGQHLIGIVSQVDRVRVPLPEELLTHDAREEETEVTRGISAAVDSSGFVWLCERLMSEQKLRIAHSGTETDGH